MQTKKKTDMKESRLDKRLSKFLSYVLRHNPHKINLHLDEKGWASIDELITKATQDGYKITRHEIETVVTNNDKQRFVIDHERNLIRANQGHSFSVDLGLEPKKPLTVLFHGTVASALEGIKQKGLQKMNRQHVHLSPDTETAIKVGARRGKPIILKIQAEKMFQDGFVFYLSQNGVWLTDNVPFAYIDFPTGA